MIRHVVLLLAIVGLWWTVGQQRAVAASPIPSALTIEPIGDVRAGDVVTVTASLTDSTGTAVGAVGNEVLQLYVNGAPQRRMRTDADGIANFRLREMSSGTVHVLVLYAGTKSLLPSSATTEFTVKPAVLDIRVVPPIQGIEVSCDNQTYSSNANGLIHIEQDQAGDAQLTLITKSVDTPSEHAVFSRWVDDKFVPDRTVTISSTSQLQLGFDVSAAVSLQFFDPLNRRVDFSRISSVTLKSTTGVVHSFTSDDPQWLLATRIVRQKSGLESAQIEWGVNSVIIDGSNVVNQGQQRFWAKRNGVWQVELLLYSGHFISRDALFGFPIGTGFELTYPGGLRQLIPNDQNGSLKLDSLVRGKYLVRVAGAPGITTASPVDVSRNQEVQLIVLSYVDIAFAVGVVFFVAVWLLFVGRPTILYVFGIRWPKTADRRPFLRVGMFAIVLMIGGLSAFDFRFRGDNLPIVPDTGSASAKSVKSKLTIPLPSNAATTGPTFTPTPQPSTSAPMPTPTPTPTSTQIGSQYSVSPVFGQFWETNGALPIFGYPTGSGVLLDPERGIVEQQFERQRLEYDPEYLGTPYVIQLSLVGTEYASQNGLLDRLPFQHVSAASTPSTESRADCVYYETTHHFVCGQFLQYWQRHGLDFGDKGTSFRESLSLFGYPISEAYVDPATGLTIQYFERARFEYHPDNPNSHKILLGRLEVNGP